MSTTIIRKHDKRRLCRCTSFCTTYDQTTRKYEGNGKWISRTSFNEHSQADAYRRQEKNNYQKHPLPSFTFIDLQTRIQTIVDEIDWLCGLPITSPKAPLCFMNPPAEGAQEIIHPVLDDRASANSCFLFVQNRLLYLCSVINDMPQVIERDVIAGQIQDELTNLDGIKLRQWQSNSGTIKSVDVGGDIGNMSSIHVVNTDNHFRNQGPSLAVAKAAVVLSVVLENTYFVKRRALRVHLSGMRAVLRANNAPLEVINAIPMDPRTCSSAFDLEPVTTQYIVCPTCHCLYPYQSDSDPNAVPVCTFRATPTSARCDTPLWRERKLAGDLYRSVPVRKYLHQDLKAWIGRLLSRPGMEDLLDNPFTPRTDPQSPVEDVWHSNVFESLKDVEGRPFFPGPGHECRLIFGLSVDGFVPLQGKTQNASATGIWMVLYNLPENLRHLPQNVFLVGIIPGPNKPATAEINHYLELLVKDMMIFWSPGNYYTRTAKYRSGRLAKALIVPAIMDHPGLRQVIGYASGSTSHYMCTECDLDIDDINVTDRSEWPMKTLEHVRRFSTLWRDASSEDDQDQIFHACGWRWSSLLSLPYWNPILFSVVDSMHALDLNLFHNHCRTLFGIDLMHPGGERKSALRKKPEKKKNSRAEKKILIQCKAVLKTNSPSLLYELLGFNRPILHSISELFGVVGPGHRQIVGTRWVLACNLHRWRVSLVDDSILSPIPSDNTDDVDSPDLELLELAGVKQLRGERVVEQLLSSRGPTNKAFGECWADLYKEICSTLSITIPERATNKVLQDVIIETITTDPLKRERLISCLPASRRIRVEENLASESEAETDADNIDEDTLPPQITKDMDNKAKHRVIRHLTDDGTPEEIAHSRKKAFAAARLPLYVELCGILGIEIHEDAKQKQHLHDAIIAEIDHNPDKFVLLSSLAPNKKALDAVLGGDVMACIWDDMKRTQLPSWMSPAPANWGTAKRGTLSADNWQVICTIHLPVTLIWLWRDSHHTSRKKQLLRNFMDLVTASRLACLRVSSPSQIAQYNKSITRYVEGIKTLFPAHKLKPTHHTAMHIGDSIHRLGPIKAINSKFYERYIKFLHFIPINCKFGEMESTMLRHSARYSNVCAILSDNAQLRLDMAELVKTTESIKKENLRGFDLASTLDPSLRDYVLPNDADSITLSDNMASMLTILQDYLELQPTSMQIHELHRVSTGGVQYAAFKSQNYRDSSIIFKRDDEADKNSLRAGVIQHIIAQKCINQNGTEKTRIFLAVNEHRRITEDGLYDPYIEFGFAAGYLCNVQTSGSHLISLTRVVSHFVSTPISNTEYIHVLPMDRLMMDLHIPGEFSD